MIPPDNEIFEVEQRIAEHRARLKQQAHEAKTRALQKMASPGALIAAAVFHDRGLTDVGDDLTAVSDGLSTYVGDGASILFGIALLASGLSSSSVGTMAGQIVMQGFVRRKIPLFVRRAVTMLPAFVVIAVGVDPSRALVLSQVVLSFGIPFALVPLLLFCRRLQQCQRHLIRMPSVQLKTHRILGRQRDAKSSPGDGGKVLIRKRSDGLPLKVGPDTGRLRD